MPVDTRRFAGFNRFKNQIITIYGFIEPSVIVLYELISFHNLIYSVLQKHTSADCLFVFISK